MREPKLFMLMLGCTPAGRNTEQHDIFFGIGETVKDLVPAITAFWPEAKGILHIDAWREVTHVNGFEVKVIPKAMPGDATEDGAAKLFFLNLGGYKTGQFDELHYKMLVVAGSKAEAIKEARQTAFYKHTGFKGAASHIDDKFGVDVDDLHQVKDILADDLKQQYKLQVTPSEAQHEDLLHLGYFMLEKL
ncbi:DUF1543 domain-containing protein [Pontibacter sp. MBLB2868]|uniref:DUF1543 domain-containing protein n=1 Tax=Pontibacter sp. MBLB2868 TaxID=3451555 RepID=UPI003F754C0D